MVWGPASESRTDRTPRPQVDSAVSTAIGDQRGQTALDFAVGMSVFLLVLTFVFAFIPGLLSPLSQSTAEETVAANRVADGLALDLLGSPDTPHVLEPDCTASFFQNQADPDCSYTGGTLNERVGISDRHSLNVTITGNVSASPNGHNRLCWDDANAKLVEEGSGNCGSAISLWVGSNPESIQETTTVRRVVSLHGTSVTLEVVIW